MALMDALPIVFPDPEPNELRSYVIASTYVDATFTNKVKKLSKAIDDASTDATVAKAQRVRVPSTTSTSVRTTYPGSTRSGSTS